MDYIRELTTKQEVDNPERITLEASIEANLAKAASPLPRTIEHAQARLAELIPQYVKAYGHLGLVKFGYFG